MELVDEVYNSLYKYFSMLSHTGYKSYKEVEQLLVFAFIEEFLYSNYYDFITNDDYKLINDSLYCLYGSCMIPYPDYKKAVNNVASKLFEGFRITEDEELRNTENSELRVKA